MGDLVGKQIKVLMVPGSTDAYKDQFGVVVVDNREHGHIIAKLEGDDTEHVFFDGEYEVM